MTWRPGAALLCALLLTATGCGSSDSTPSSSADPFSVVPTQPADSTIARRRAAPRWERVATFTGSGPATKAFTIARGAIQWRARWRCDSGTLRLSASSRAVRRSLEAAPCPRRGESSGFRSGRLELGVDTPGRWRLVLEQQVDTALREPALAAMRSPAAHVLAHGRFYDIERFGRGTAALYRLPGGRLALRLTEFVTSANTDLFVWLDRAARPRTTVQAKRAGHRVLAPLKSTLGEQNYLLPAGTTAADIDSIVIWCEPVQIAYTAAALRRPT
jgi:hypothetical protein